MNAARNGTFRLAISEAIIAEIRGVLRDKFRWSEEMLDEVVSGLRDFTHLVKPVQMLRVIAEDPDDDRVIECTVASNSQFIVSGDRHLLHLVQYENIRVLKVAEFLKLIPMPSV